MIDEPSSRNPIQTGIDPCLVRMVSTNTVHEYGTSNDLRLEYLQGTIPQLRPLVKG